MADQKKTPIRQGSAVSQDGAEDYAARASHGGEITSNGVFTKVLRDGKVEIVPTSEIYAEEAEDRVQGVQVEDPTVIGAPVLRGHGAIVDRLEREFNTQERGDAVSKQHAQGAAGSLGRARDEVPAVKLEKGAFEKDQKEIAKRRTAARKQAEKEGGEEEGGFDAKNPEATTLADLPGALEGASDEDVKKASKKDSRAGAEAIYAKRLGK